MPFKRYSDEELFHFIKNGERLAFEELYDRYKRPLVAYTLKKVFDEVAEDLVHDLWVKIWEKRDIIEIKGTVVAYLFKAARNKIIDHMAHSAVSRKYVDAVEQFAIHDYDGNTDYRLREEFFLKQIQSLLDKYGPKANLIVRMRLEGYKNDEIAEELNLSEKTIRNQYSSIIKYLKSKIPYLIFFSFYLYLFIEKNGLLKYLKLG